ncbi:MAG: helix-turn-helix transcriptional regulator [Dorea sp.]|jgi:hypothetical protein|nr:helix-turn-helix transcriptional regulator [Dorea sp.]
MDFLEKLNFLMAQHNYNKNSLSKASGIPYTTIDNWYKRGYDNLQLPTVKKLCSFFGTSLDFWLREEISDPNYGKSNGFSVDYEEMEHIKKYRFVAQHSPEGAKTITYVLEREHAIAKHMTELESENTEAKNHIEKPAFDRFPDDEALSFLPNFSALDPRDLAALEEAIKFL